MYKSEIQAAVERAFRAGRTVESKLRQAAIDAARVDERKLVLQELHALIDALIHQVESKPAEEQGIAAASNGNSKVEQAPPKGLPPSLRKALELVNQRPGITAWAARPSLGNKNALYALRDRGLVEKRGSQFYPLS